MRTVFSIFILSVLSILSLQAQTDTTFKPGGKVVVQRINRTYENTYLNEIIDETFFSTY